MKTLQAELPNYARGLFIPKRYKVYWGGRGAARSWSFARAILIMGAQRKLRVLCAREFQKSIADSVHKLFQDQIQLLNLPGWQVTQKEIIHYGHQHHLRGSPVQHEPGQVARGYRHLLG